MKSILEIGAFDGMKVYLSKDVKNILQNLVPLHPCKLSSYSLHARCARAFVQAESSLLVCFSSAAAAATRSVSRAAQSGAAAPES